MSKNQKRDTIMVLALTILMIGLSTYILLTKDIEVKELLFLIMTINVVGAFIYVYIYKLKDETKKLFLTKISDRMCYYSYVMLVMTANLMNNDYTFYYTLLVLASATIALIMNVYAEKEEKIIYNQCNDDLPRRMSKVDYLYLFLIIALHFIIVILYFAFVQSQNDGYIAEFIIICIASIISCTSFIYSFFIQSIERKVKMLNVTKYSLYAGAITSMVFMTTYNSVIFKIIAGYVISYVFLFAIFVLNNENIKKRNTQVNN